MILCIVILLAIFSTSVYGTTIEVSPVGSLKSLEDARDHIRTLRKAGETGAMKVVLRKGTYRLERTFVLTPEDSGTPEAPISYEAFPGERVVISGGRDVGTGLKKESSNTWAWHLPDVESGAWNFRQLFINGVRAQRSRAPNFGYYRSSGESSQDKPFRLKFSDEEILKPWEGIGAEAIVLLRWTEIRQQIVAVDEREHVAVLAGDAGGTEAGIPQDTDPRFFIENAPGTLDMPGEWYLDCAAGVLHYWPFGWENPARAEVIAPHLTQLVRIQGDAAADKYVSNVTFQNLHFCEVDWSLPQTGHADYPQAAVKIGAAFEADSATNCQIVDCSFERLGGYAIWFRHACNGNRVIGNRISDIGGGGVKVGETVMHDNPGQQTGGQVIEDNVIHHLGKVYPESVGIWVGQSSQNAIVHNTIHDLFYTAVSVGWTWGFEKNQCSGNRIEHNHIYDIGKYTLNDLGAIYTLGEQPGTVIRHNLIHDINSFADRGRGIYLDEGSTDILVENNIVYRCKSAGFHQHYGRENIVRNNIFAFNHDAQFARGKSEPHRSFTFERNIIYYDHGELIAGAWKDNQYLVRDNIYFDARNRPVLFAGASAAEWLDRTKDTGSLFVDPMFVAPERFDFRLLPDSPARSLGFQPIDLQDAGARRHR